MEPVSYQLPVGSFSLYPPVDILDPNPPQNVYPLGPQPATRAFASMLDVIQYYTAVSLFCEGFTSIANLTVTGSDVADDPVVILMQVGEHEVTLARQFGGNHLAFLAAGQKALTGVSSMQQTAAWNPMAGFPVNKSDGICQWSLYLPLGMAMRQQKAVVLMHYPPRIAMVHADYLHNNTLSRWQNLLTCCGDTGNFYAYTTIVDVNPIAAPGSGQSEYANDYFPIMMSSLFFDNAAIGADYIRQMVMTLLTPGLGPYGQTLPLMVCGSPAYDPQATGWFRVAYKDQMPLNSTGTPQANVLQTGSVVLIGQPPSPVQTPYILANHMIAAGVEGKNTGRDWANSANLPDIRQYEAQDLSATTALLLMGQGVDPATARAQGCARWYGTSSVPIVPTGIPVPPADADKALLCAMGLVDIYFNVQTVKPYYTLAQAQALVTAAVQQYGSQMPPAPEFQYPIAYNPLNTAVYPPPHGNEVDRRPLASV